MFDYKKIIKSRATRIKILHLLDFIPCKLMLVLQYFIKTGHKLNLKKSQRYTEKLQWYKLYYRNPIIKQCVDKYDVRQYVEKCGLKDILNECYGIFDCAECVDFNKLPNSFVLKDTLGGGGNDIIIVKDKSKLNIKETIERMKEWVNYPYKGKHPGREWAYENKKHRIIIEKYLTDTNQPNGIVDYKFLCFQGKPQYIVLDVDRYTNHRRNIYTLDWKYLPIETDHKTYGDKVSKPVFLTEMEKITEQLSNSFPAVRVDLYQVNGHIYFGELTFYPWSGYVKFNPDTFDFDLGKEFILPYGDI